MCEYINTCKPSFKKVNSYLQYLAVVIGQYLGKKFPA